jgi:hypothetical protein
MMGKYSDSLAERLRNKGAAIKPDPNAVRLKCVAIVRDGVVHDGLRSHYELRAALGDSSPQTSNFTDIEGFMTSAGRFVTREEAQDIALAAGQIRSAQRRPLLSSDIDW